MTRGFALSLTLQLAILLGGIQTLFSEASYAATLRESDSGALAITIRHVGEQDRAIPRLVLYSGIKDVLVPGFDCGKSTSCFCISADAFDRLTYSLNSHFFSQGHDDLDIEQAGSFQFSIESRRAPKTLRMNRVHSSAILQELIELVQQSAIRRELEWRLSIARI